MLLCCSCPNVKMHTICLSNNPTHPHLFIDYQGSPFAFCSANSSALYGGNYFILISVQLNENLS